MACARTPALRRLRTSAFTLAGSVTRHIGQPFSFAMQAIVMQVDRMASTKSGQAERVKPNIPRLGEVQLKHWIKDRAVEAGITERGAWVRLHQGKMDYLPLRRVNKRVIFVMP